MSHSQFHCIKSFILRHAWLNLWDKHMTTGRINQVTILKRRQTNSPSQKVCWVFDSTSFSRRSYSPDLLIVDFCTYRLPKQVGISQNVEILMTLPWDLTPVFIDSELRVVFNTVSQIWIFNESLPAGRTLKAVSSRPFFQVSDLSVLIQVAIHTSSSLLNSKIYYLDW